MSEKDLSSEYIKTLHNLKTEDNSNLKMNEGLK
jgi:hypothetical protein